MLNKQVVRSHEMSEGGYDPKSTTKTTSKQKAEEARKWMCDNFFDVRTFGAVLSIRPGAGQVRGAIQFSFARSVDPILPLDLSITRVARSERDEDVRSLRNVKSFKDYVEWERNQPEGKLRDWGHKSLIPYGLYTARGFISAHLAQGTDFSEDDLELFWEALLNMYEHDRSASKGMMSARGLYVFKHVGTDGDPQQRVRQAMLGCAPAHVLFDKVTIERVDEIKPPRRFSDYRVHIDEEIPAGVELVKMLG